MNVLAFGCILFIGLVTQLEAAKLNLRKYMYHTCEFDMTKKFAPDEKETYNRPFTRDTYNYLCRELFDKPTQKQALLNKMLEESTLFGQYLANMQKHDVAFSQKALCGGGEYIEDKDLRSRIHKTVHIFECYRATSTMNFLDCMIVKRKEMMKMIP